MKIQENDSEKKVRLISCESLILLGFCNRLQLAFAFALGDVIGFDCVDQHGAPLLSYGFTVGDE